MSVLRIVSLSLLVLAAVYVAWIQAANPAPVALPGLGSLAVGWVLALVAVVAFLAAWLPARLRRWRDRRERMRLERRVAELESHLPTYDPARRSAAEGRPRRPASPVPDDEP